MKKRKRKEADARNRLTPVNRRKHPEKHLTGIDFTSKDSVGAILSEPGDENRS